MLDAQRRASPEKTLGPLFGLPISIKDSFNIKGSDSTIGFGSYANKPSHETGKLPELLLDLGAVIHCKTNIPQTMMTFDSDNNVWGRTLNPHNTAFTAGGSSGGEGALVAMAGSAIGIGADIGGSIRIPGHFNGVYGLKPTSNIVPFSGQAFPIHPGMPIFAPSAGPLARSMRDCRFFVQVILEAGAWTRDVTCAHISWTPNDSEIQSRKLRIGFVKDDGILTPTPPVQRSLQEAADKLEAAGHIIVPIKLPQVAEIMTAVREFFTMDGLKVCLRNTFSICAFLLICTIV